MEIKNQEPRCILCGSRNNITFHHLIPKTCHTNKWFKKNFTKTEMQERGIDICRSCHSFIHKKFTEKQLGRELNTLAKLMESEQVMNYVKWARKKTTGKLRVGGVVD